MNKRRIRIRNRLISWFPQLNRLSETRWLLSSAKQWREQGWTNPPPYFVKRAALLGEARAMGAEVFVETGTFLGDTTWAFRREFGQIYTIEVEPSLAKLAKERFANHSHIEVIEGDSSDVLLAICGKIKAPCLFYLDGHYSGGITGMGDTECPILEELDAIFDLARYPFRIVIDDARLFGVDPSYPTIDRLRAHLLQRDPTLEIRVENDAIMISLPTPRE